MESPRFERRYAFGSYVLDVHEQTLRRNGVDVSLTPRAFDTLRVLVERQGQLVTKDELLGTVWHGTSVEDNNITQQISTLRRALEAAGEAVRIETVPRRGYRMLEAVRLVNGDAPVAGGVTSRRLRRLVWIAASLAALSAAVVSWKLSPLAHRSVETAAAVLGVERATNLGNVGLAAISRDGRHLAYVTIAGPSETLSVKDLATGKTAVLVPSVVGTYRGLTVAPDGWIYYAWFRPDLSAVGQYRVSLNGGAAEVLPYLRDLPSFSADGSRLACVSTTSSSIQESRLLIYDLASGTQRAVAVLNPPDTFVQTKPAWSPDGKRVAVWTMSERKPDVRQLVAVDIDTGRTRVVATEGLHSIEGLLWGSDGSSIIISARERASSPLKLWDISVSSGARRPLSADFGDYRLSGATADGERIAVVRVDVARSLWVGPLEDFSRARQVVADAGELAGLESLAWTTEGHVLYTSSEAGNADIWSVDPASGTRRQLTTSTYDDFHPAGTIDGGRVIFASDRSGSRGIWSISVEGERSARQLTAGGDSRPTVSPDGRWIVFQRGIVQSKPIELWRVPLEGGEATPIAEGTAIRPAVSPDARFVAYYWLTPVRWTLAVMPISGGLPVHVLPVSSSHFGRSVRWSPDGRALAYLESQDGAANIWLQPLDGRAPYPLTRFTSGDIQTFDWSSDGRQLAWIRRHDVSDVLLLDLSGTR